MSIFNRDKERTEPPGESQPKTSPEYVKSENIRKMSGFDGLNDLAGKAPQTEETPEQQRPARQSRGKKPAVDEQKLLDELKAKELAAKKARAREIVGKRIMIQCAEIPYETWAFFLQDSALRLTPEESKELADIYIELASCYDADFSSPLWLIPTILMSHYDMVTKRLAYLNKKESEKKQKEKDKIPTTITELTEGIASDLDRPWTNKKQ